MLHTQIALFTRRKIKPLAVEVTKFSLAIMSIFQGPSFNLVLHLNDDIFCTAVHKIGPQHEVTDTLLMHACMHAFCKPWIL
jgi:hypothetical protein